jgi:hypothetical protein
MSDRTHALLSPPVPALTPAEDDAVTLAALLDAMERTGLALQVIIPEHGQRIYLLRDINEPATAPIEAYARSLPSLLGLIR